MRTRRLRVLALTVLVLGGAAAYAYYQTRYGGTQNESELTVATSQVLVGDLVIAVSGTGTLVAASETEIGFKTQGYLDELWVDVGDFVSEGELLARIDTQDLENAVLEADVTLRLARLSLEELLQDPDESEIADAEAAVESARDSLHVAQLSYRSSENSSADAAVRARQIQFQYDVERFYAAENASDGTSKGEAKVAEAWAAWSASEAALNEAVHQAEIEQLEAWHAVQQAQQRLAEGEAALELTYSGPATETLLAAELDLFKAELSADDAQAALDAAELRAPFKGTVTSVDATVGQLVGSAPVVTLVDLERPILQFWVEEQDMPGVAAGNRIEIIFEALPDLTFRGEVFRIDPALVTVDQTLAVQAWATVEVSDHPTTTLLSGMNAAVEVISAESRETLLVPLQALRELTPGAYAVFVVGADGELELRPVEVGLSDFANAEIVSGLEEGEVLSLGDAHSGTAPDGEVVAPTQEMIGMPGGAGGVLEGGGMRGPPSGPGAVGR